MLRDGKGVWSSRGYTFCPYVAALTIAKALIKRAQLLESSWLFSTYGKSQLRGETLTNAAAEVRDAMLTAKPAKARFDLRDLRRTAETEMAASGSQRKFVHRFNRTGSAVYRTGITTGTSTWLRSGRHLRLGQST